MTPKSISRVCIDAVHAQTGVMVLTDAMAERIASAVLSAAEQPELPAPRPEWPVSVEAVEAYKASPDHDNYSRRVGNGLAAAAPHLWRALVESLPGHEVVLVGSLRVYRQDLAALADPYDGGVT